MSTFTHRPTTDSRAVGITQKTRSILISRHTLVAVACFVFIGARLVFAQDGPENT